MIIPVRHCLQRGIFFLVPPTLHVLLRFFQLEVNRELIKTRCRVSIHLVIYLLYLSIYLISPSLFTEADSHRVLRTELQTRHDKEQRTLYKKLSQALGHIDWDEERDYVDKGKGMWKMTKTRVRTQTPLTAKGVISIQHQAHTITQSQGDPWRFCHHDPWDQITPLSQLTMYLWATNSNPLQLKFLV